MKALQYIVLTFIIFVLPSFLLIVAGSRIGSVSSYLVFILLIGYYFLNKKGKPALLFLVLGVCHYIISGIIYVEYFNDFIIEFIKYMIFIICAKELAKDTDLKTLIVFLLLGASSIFIHAVLGDPYGRYSGFYINPNGAGFICIIGYAACYGVDNKKFKLIFQLLFTIAGILTFSRTFMLLWFVITLISTFVKKENFLNLGLGFLMLVLLLSITSFLDLNTVRLSMIENIVSGDIGAPNSTISSGSRMDTWKEYYDIILQNPIFGNGNKALSGVDGIKQGVHNSYLMIIGESGIISFLIFVSIYLGFMVKGVKIISSNPTLLYIAIALFSILFVTHTIFTNYFLLFISLWLYTNIKKESELNS